MSRIPKTPDQIKNIFDKYPTPIKNKLIELREIIYNVATTTDGVGSIHETLKWSQPSFLTTKPKSGTTIRIDYYPHPANHIALFVHCQTSLIETYRLLYPKAVKYEGNRAILLDITKPFPKELTHCIELALTYHLK